MFQQCEIRLCICFASDISRCREDVVLLQYDCPKNWTNPPICLRFALEAALAHAQCLWFLLWVLMGSLWPMCGDLYLYGLCMFAFLQISVVQMIICLHILSGLKTVLKVMA